MRREIAYGRLASAAPRFAALAGIGFVALIYIPAGWKETTVLVLAIGCELVGLVGYGLRWKAHRVDRSHP